MIRLGKALGMFGLLWWAAGAQAASSGKPPAGSNEDAANTLHCVRLLDDDADVPESTPLQRYVARVSVALSDSQHEARFLLAGLQKNNFPYSQALAEGTENLAMALAQGLRSATSALEALGPIGDEAAERGIVVASAGASTDALLLKIELEQILDRLRLCGSKIQTLLQGRTINDAPADEAAQVFRQIDEVLSEKYYTLLRRDSVPLPAGTDIRLFSPRFVAIHNKANALMRLMDGRDKNNVTALRRSLRELAKACDPPSAANAEDPIAAEAMGLMARNVRAVALHMIDRLQVMEFERHPAYRAAVLTGVHALSSLILPQLAAIHKIPRLYATDITRLFNHAYLKEWVCNATTPLNTFAVDYALRRHDIRIAELGWDSQRDGQTHVLLSSEAGSPVEALVHPVTDGDKNTAEIIRLGDNLLIHDGREDLGILARFTGTEGDETSVQVKVLPLQAVLMATQTPVPTARMNGEQPLTVDQLHMARFTTLTPAQDPAPVPLFSPLPAPAIKPAAPKKPNRNLN